MRPVSLLRTRWSRPFVVSILLLALSLPPRSFAAPVATWEQLSPLPQSNDLVRAAFAGGWFVAVGKYGTILASRDAVDWQLRESRTEEPLGGITWGNGVYVVVGGDAREDGCVLMSHDGVVWQTAYHEPGRQLSDVTFANDRFVAVGGKWEGNGDYSLETSEGALVLTSVDGTDWVPQDPISAAYGFRRVTYAGGQFVAVGGPGAIATSPDGLTWTLRKSGTEGQLRGVAYGNGVYVAVGWESDGGGLILTSNDGGRWIQRAAEPGFQFTDVTFGNGRFVVVGRRGGATSICETSTDGITWAKGDTGTDLALLSVTSGNDEFVAVGQAGMIMSSADGSEWKKRLKGTVTWLGDIAFGVDRFVIVGAQGAVLVSTDGETLTEKCLDRAWSLHRVSYADGIFVCIGSDGTSFSSFTSADGVTWNGPHLITGYNGCSLTRISRWRGQFVVSVMELGIAYVSKDGARWTELPGRVTAGRMADATVVSDVLVVSGAMWAPEGVRTTQGTMGSFIAVSVDGRSWDLAYSDRCADAPLLAYGGGKALAAGSTSLAWSMDGLVWDPVPGHAFTGIRPSFLTYAGGWFLASGGTTAPGHCRVLVSRNGSQWTPVSPERGQGLGRVAYGHGKFIGIGNNGAILSLTLPEATFLDVPPGDPVHEAAELLAARKVVAGFEDGLFHPERNVTRAEFAKMVVTATGLRPDPAAILSFTDTAGHWSAAQGYLQAAVTARVVAGYPDRTFRPDGAVTRAEVVKMVAAAASLTSLQHQGKLPYPDVTPADWFAGWVAAAYQANLIGPASRFVIWPDQFRGGDLCTRAEAATVLANLLERR